MKVSRPLAIDAGPIQIAIHDFVGSTFCRFDTVRTAGEVVTFGDLYPEIPEPEEKPTQRLNVRILRSVSPSAPEILYSQRGEQEHAQLGNWYEVCVD